jgi:hypothetical protein
MNKTHLHHIGRREFFIGSAIAALGITSRGSEITAGVRHRHAGAADSPSVHGMLLFGEKTAYLSHLPLFSMGVHRYQVILEVTLTKSGSDAQAAYAQDRRQHSNTKIYTFEPEPFVLPELDPRHSQRTSFKGNIFRGHFERGGVGINRDVTATVTRVIHFRKFDPQAAKLPQLEYILFGKAPEMFLAHLITTPPDFDQVLPVKQTDRKFTDEELSKGAPIIFPGIANSPQKRIRNTQQVTGQMKGPAAQTIKIRPGVEVYFEAGELAS